MVPVVFVAVAVIMHAAGPVAADLGFVTTVGIDAGGLVDAARGADDESEVVGAVEGFACFGVNLLIEAQQLDRKFGV